jgi:DNA modification methylase
MRMGVQDKSHHEWGHGLEEIQYYIDTATEPGDLVVDPCVGGGTVAVACKRSGRRFIGTELDPVTAAGARQRVSTD